MNTIYLFLLAFLPGPPQAGFRPVITLQNPPQDGTSFVQKPVAMDMDRAGNFYLLDAAAKTIWRWSAAGKYLGRFGGPGKGPGEFSFSKSLNTHRPSISVEKNEIWVFDDGPHQFSVFSRDGRFLRNMNAETEEGHVHTALLMNQNQMLILSKGNERNPPRYAASLQKRGETRAVKTLRWVMPKPPKRSDHFLEGFSNQLALHYHPQRRQLLAGTGVAAQFQIHEDGKEARVLTFAAKARPVTAEDREEFKRYEAANYNHKHPLEFREYQPFYTHLATVGKKGYLAYSLSPYDKQLHGYWLDAKGKILGVLRTVLGEDGNLLAARGHLLQITTNSDGHFKLQTVMPHRAIATR